ncbi:hypothetical protein BX666DRAFT_1928484, partial [Dichotomocladium elegans]
MDGASNIRLSKPPNEGLCLMIPPTFPYPAIIAPPPRSRGEGAIPIQSVYSKSTSRMSHGIWSGLIERNICSTNGP